MQNELKEPVAIEEDDDLEEEQDESLSSIQEDLYEIKAALEEQQNEIEKISHGILSISQFISWAAFIAILLLAYIIYRLYTLHV